MEKHEYHEPIEYVSNSNQASAITTNASFGRSTINIISNDALQSASHLKHDKPKCTDGSYEMLQYGVGSSNEYTTLDLQSACTGTKMNTNGKYESLNKESLPDVLYSEIN